MFLSYTLWLFGFINLIHMLCFGTEPTQDESLSFSREALLVVNGFFHPRTPLFLTYPFSFCRISFLLYIYIFFNLNLFILIGGKLLYNIVLILPYINMNPPRVYMCSPSWTPLLLPSPYHPSGSSQCTSPKHPVSCIKSGLVICFSYDIIHVSVPFSQIIPPSPSPTESKRLFYTSVSLLLSHIQGYRFHLSKFHIYALVYCIGVFLSGLLHSV